METPAQIDHQRLTSLINSMADGVIAVDAHAKIALYNGAALNILDLNESMEGKSLGAVLHAHDKDGNAVDIVDIVTQTKTATFTRDYQLQFAEGSIMNLYISIAPVHFGYGKDKQHGYVIVLRDITREKSLEEERDEFISVVSHELRTPIAITEGNISNAQFLAERADVPANITQALDEAHRQVLFLADMINDLSTLSRADRGVLAVEPEAINAHDLVRELASNYAASAEQKKLALHTDIDERLEMLYSGKLYVREVLQNFITNAIKYTDKGSVTIGAHTQADGIEFWVRDTGIGISKSDQKRIFDKFFRSEDYRTRQNNGTGLGLYVTIKLCKLLHATVRVESTLNKGSTFYVAFPNLSATAA